MSGFYRIAAATPVVQLAQPHVNAVRIVELVQEASRLGASAVVFPELSLTGYTCGDLFFRSDLQTAALEGLQTVLHDTATLDLVIAVGLPLRIGNALYNVAAVLQKGRLLGLVPKTHLPNYGEYYEKRQFTPAKRLTVSEVNLFGGNVPLGNDLVFAEPSTDFSVGVEICEDLWMPTPVSSSLSTGGARAILNLSASTEFLSKGPTRRARVLAQSAAADCVYALAAAGCGESTADAIFGGQALIAEGGRLRGESALFPTGPQIVSATADFAAVAHRRLRFAGWNDAEPSRVRTIPLGPVPSCEPENISQTPFFDIFCEPNWARKVRTLQAVGLGERLRRTHLRHPVIGVSGGADSALALLGSLAAVERLGQPASDVIAVVMPGPGSTEATQSSAATLARALGCTTRIVPIAAACAQHFSDIGHDPATIDLTYENVQARIRTLILMDIAGEVGGLVVGTGDLSEIALGWSTYNGDHMSMYALNASVPKTMVYAALTELADDYPSAAAEELKRIAATPASPELVPGAPADGTESRIGPYPVHDFLLYHTLVNGSSDAQLTALARAAFCGVYDDATLDKALTNFLRRFGSQQFKRNCVPDGPKITLSLSPRADWRMPSDLPLR